LSSVSSFSEIFAIFIVELIASGVERSAFIKHHISTDYGEPIKYVPGSWVACAFLGWLSNKYPVPTLARSCRGARKE